jgi:hypothetical protein
MAGEELCMKKRYLLKAARFTGLVIAAALVFTACQDTDERLMTFYNESRFAINVTCSGSTPSYFTLHAPKDVNDHPSQVVTRTGKDIDYEWSIPGDSYSDQKVSPEKVGTGITFKDKYDAGGNRVKK